MQATPDWLGILDPHGLPAMDRFQHLREIATDHAQLARKLDDRFRIVRRQGRPCLNGGPDQSPHDFRFRQAEQDDCFPQSRFVRFG